MNRLEQIRLARAESRFGTKQQPKTKYCWSSLSSHFCSLVRITGEMQPFFRHRKFFEGKGYKLQNFSGIVRECLKDRG